MLCNFRRVDQCRENWVTVDGSLGYSGTYPSYGGWVFYPLDSFHNTKPLISEVVAKDELRLLFFVFLTVEMKKALDSRAGKESRTLALMALERKKNLMVKS